MKVICLLLALCIYTQSFGYFALSASSHNDCQEWTSPIKKGKHSCCKSKKKNLCLAESENDDLSCGIQADMAKPHCCKAKNSSKDHQKRKGCQNTEDCDCQCCFHFHGLQVLYFSSCREHYLQSIPYARSNHNYQGVVEKDPFMTIFHPPRI